MSNAMESLSLMDDICPITNMKIWVKCNQSASNNARTQIIQWKLIRCWKGPETNFKHKLVGGGDGGGVGDEFNQLFN